MIAVHRIDHVCLKVADLAEAVPRWSIQFGLVERYREDGRALLACNDEPYCLELVESDEPPGYDHAAFELHRDCSLAEATECLARADVVAEEREGSLFFEDPDGRALQLMPYREPENPFVQHARPNDRLHPGGPRKLGHLNCLTGALRENFDFYTQVLGMRVTDWLGAEGVWLHFNTDHHGMALVDKGEGRLHHFAFDVVDIGKMRDMLDHLGRHGRWLGYGPVRHGIGGNVASYVRIPEESCFVELYCDLEQIQEGHVPRVYPDDRFSTNTWGPLPPRSYFRFDDAAIESERESLEMRGIPLPPPVQAT